LIKPRTPAVTHLGIWAAAAACLLLLGVQFGSAAPQAGPSAVSAGATLRLGQTQTLYVLRGRPHGLLGVLAVSCSASGVSTTRFTLAKSAPDTIVAVDGRGVSRAAQLASERPTLLGGRGDGLEQWFVKAANEPEQVTLRASLYAVTLGTSPSPRAKPAYCQFGLTGTLDVHMH
jgi:hypothetical protein